MNAIFLASCLGLIVRVPTLPDTVDRVEINHVFSDNGDGTCRETLRQLIFWDWYEPASQFDIVAWRILKDDTHYPRHDSSTGAYVVRMVDGGNIRVIRARARIETWTPYDPELELRGDMPQEKRSGLTRKVVY